MQQLLFTGVMNPTLSSAFLCVLCGKCFFGLNPVPSTRRNCDGIVNKIVNLYVP
jgi:hypothetical protein